jgi:uncharacterized membrane protein
MLYSFFSFAAPRMFVRGVRVTEVNPITQAWLASVMSYPLQPVYVLVELLLLLICQVVNSDNHFLVLLVGMF